MSATHRNGNGKGALDLAAMLRLRDGPQAELHRKAEQLRHATFGRKVFIRGVVEVSNYCRQNCNYCGMRRDNRDLSRYRLSLEQLLDVILNHRPSSITDINIQAGEDPIAVREVVIPLVREIRSRTDLGVSVCLGTLSSREYEQLREAGASYYIIKLETGDEEHYARMQAPGSLKKRVEAIRHLAASGWSVSSGMILGLPGQDLSCVVKTLSLLSELPLIGCSVSPFIAGEQTPYAKESTGDLGVALNAIALMRLARPDRIIPAVSAFNLVGKNGYAQALWAGANLATINLTPDEWRENYLLYKRDRFIMSERKVLDAIAETGGTPSEESLARFLSARATSSRTPDAVVA